MIILLLVPSASLKTSGCAISIVTLFRLRLIVKWLREAIIIFANMIMLFRFALLWTMDRRLWTKKTPDSELLTRKNRGLESQKLLFSSRLLV